MDAPRNSHDSTELVDIRGVSPALLEAEAGKDTVFGQAVRRHLQERDGSSRTTDVVFESAL
ncbi:FxSxx-COOH cyclophane-containing RiPP peptide [Streptomyces caniscabiei]|nr:FxSxx-COOH cyclophane-containing RiPP peptide [Streptomyces caniscabiei]MDX3514264.1 FxSxx-COOH protein [Streptomyces caniscabiei]MDX3716710.1 FxSxx-COOH protein [Streptomyces caniscabiei]MDX3730896.1 FxSxx-COOH protein [Streptomyces caniscabiei]WEO22594.1 FxSxx-COOH protein [Streptomyces caniscabiei]